MDAKLRVRLCDAIGEKNVISSQIAEHYLSDFHGKMTSKPMALLKPENTKQVAQCMRIAYDHEINVVPFGGNTGYCLGTIAGENAFILSLERMNAIRDIDTTNLTITVESGAVLQNIQQAADAEGMYFPLHLGSAGSCQIGGNLSTNAGGVNVLKYGMTRQFCLGLEVVLPDGTIVDELHLLRKNNSGYDLKQLFIGAEGTLGIITAASFMLYPKANQHVTAMIALKDMRECVKMLAEFRRDSGDLLTSFEYFSKVTMNLAERHHNKSIFNEDYQHFALIEFSTSSPYIELQELVLTMMSEYIEAGQLLDVIVAQSEQQRMDFWQMRETVPEAERAIGNAVRHDVSMSVSDLPDMVEDFYAYLESLNLLHKLNYSVYGHIGDGNLHMNLIDTDGVEHARLLEISDNIYALTAKYHGSFSAEHGVGLFKKPVFEKYKNKESIALMQKIKNAIDDRNIMNRGKILD